MIKKLSLFIRRITSYNVCYTKLLRKEMYFSKKALELLQTYPWPGNIRELQNTMERIVLICPAGELQPEMLNHILPFNFQKMYMPEEEVKTPVMPTVQSIVHEPQHEELPSSLTKSSLEEMEKEAIIKALIENIV